MSPRRKSPFRHVEDILARGRSKSPKHEKHKNKALLTRLDHEEALAAALAADSMRMLVW
jgi:hypothetical protein